MEGYDSETNGYVFDVHLLLDGSPLMAYDASGDESFEATTNSSGYLQLRVKADEEKVLRIPWGSEMTITEKDYERYFVSTSSNNAADMDTESARVFQCIVQENDTITFTNTRKPQTVTVKKLFEDSSDSESIPFTATLMQENVPLSDYTVFSGEEQGDALVTDEDGKVSFLLEHEETQVLTIPYGTKLVVTESTEDYIAEITTINNTSDEDDIDNSFTMTVTNDDTVTFTNRKVGLDVVLKKVGVNNTDVSQEEYALENATFTIYTSEIGTTIAEDTSGNSLSGMTSGENGIFFTGKLKPGTYYLEETHVPGGYIAPQGRYILVVDREAENTSIKGDWITGDPEHSAGSVSANETNGYIITIRNVTGYELPSTGGPGTTLIHLLGLLLTGLAGIGLLLKRTGSKRTE